MFPRTVWADRNTLWQQFRHLVSEVWEVFVCLVVGDYDGAARELVDVQHSADTALNILHEGYEVDRDLATARVIIGNRRRGYYGEKPAQGSEHQEFGEST